MSPRSTEQNEQIRAERIEQIMQAALEVYIEKGIRGTEMGDIAKKAGIARGLVYYYYKNKMDLFRELFTRYIQLAQTFIQSSLTAEEEAITKLKKYTRFYMEMVQNRPDLMRFYRNMENDITLVFETDAEAVHDSYTLNTHQPLIQAFKQAMNEGTIKKSDPKIIVNVYWGALTGTLDLFVNGQIKKEDLEQTIHHVIDLIFNDLQHNNP
ncbi:TetR family transcriptional regulator [Aneurinibacillus soli]|uniref:HTH-type transcriptional regulator MtrR n=1 Tax=Aneurinibacillus soli TaxID=1500254 RepID=A0A0U5BEP1_9BACL|nr:TetR/AcrR family transcriptional regulator [Aneurinibacillus soli]PYE62085.1 TetR family transcriptional regulator [Aneurinibacillus soli]BAU28727.1 HTH-type transcriptional regulator MtrR [Aneurinibacillus soli]